jgi:hypothetical protein
MVRITVILLLAVLHYSMPLPSLPDQRPEYVAADRRLAICGLQNTQCIVKLHTIAAKQKSHESQFDTQAWRRPNANPIPNLMLR